MSSFFCLSAQVVWCIDVIMLLASGVVSRNRQREAVMSSRSWHCEEIPNVLWAAGLKQPAACKANRRGRPVPPLILTLCAFSDLGPVENVLWQQKHSRFQYVIIFFFPKSKSIFKIQVKKIGTTYNWVWPAESPLKPILGWKQLLSASKRRRVHIAFWRNFVPDFLQHCFSSLIYEGIHLFTTFFFFLFYGV